MRVVLNHKLVIHIPGILPPGSRTASYVSEDALIEAEKHFSANAVSRAAFRKLNANAANTTIPIYFHIISSDMTIDGGNIS